MDFEEISQTQPLILDGAAGLYHSRGGHMHASEVQLEDGRTARVSPATLGPTIPWAEHHDIAKDDVEVDDEVAEITEPQPKTLNRAPDVSLLEAGGMTPTKASRTGEAAASSSPAQPTNSDLMSYMKQMFAK